MRVVLRQAQFCGGSFPSRCLCREAAFLVLTSKKLHQQTIHTTQKFCQIDFAATRRRHQRWNRSPSSPPKPALDGPAPHRTVRDMGVRHHTLVLQQPEQLAVPRQINPPAVFRFSNFPIDTDLSHGRQLPRRERGARGRHLQGAGYDTRRDKEGCRRYGVRQRRASGLVCSARLRRQLWTRYVAGG